MRFPLTGHRSALATFSALAAACLVLAACGSGGSTTSTSAAGAGGSSAAAPSGAGARGGARFATLRTCLAKQGITLPQRTPGQRRPPTGATGGGGVLGGRGFGAGAGGFRPPAGVSAQKFQAALKKCGGAGLGSGRFNSPAFKAALAKFASCMSSHGVKLPAPNTSGTGPVFNTKGLNTTSAAFKAADAKCAPDLRGRFGPRGGAGPGAPATPAA